MQVQWKRRSLNMRIYDLTRSLEPGMGVYPGDPEVRFHVHTDYPEHGFRVTELRLGTHTGTHMDAPAHFLPGEAGVDGLALAALAGPARVLDAEDLAPVIGAGERVLVRSGWGRRWGANDYFTGFPALPEGMVRAALAGPAALIGLETPSLHPDGDEDHRLHRRLLGAGIVIVENLAGLEELPERVWLAALPLPLRGLDGAPCRVVAVDAGEGRKANTD